MSWINAPVRKRFQIARMNIIDSHMSGTLQAASDTAFLIVVREVLVGQDIAQAIAEAMPGSNIISTTTMEEAAALVIGVRRIATAFVAFGPDDFDASPLASLILDRGGRIILMGPAAEASSGDWPVLSYPFSTSAIEACLASQDRNRTGA